ncbi:hypothetical protein OQY15_18265 [Pedobacter sp. MC2016-15]|uniref:hypothetical protein n=1 Tax=Pedobacter sp. MC2016-15 TaxID=2994473 RepID=UPI002245EEAD|nr:hypothetical protein [Pedobacter sp. MC2016-15]MCX2481055.1 hypothetical protein [Pedobacter sp. MC2016-15]
MKEIDFWVNFTANLLTVLASGMAIYVYLTNKDKLASALNSILNYSNQLTLSELKYKIERLNDYNASNAEQNLEVINIFHDIEGQILGNIYLKDQLGGLLTKLSVFTSKGKPITEPKKRSLVSELRESVRTLDVSNFVMNKNN